MSDKTGIEWTRGDDGRAGATWNPVVGCTPVSPGCDNCYAAREASGRLAANPATRGIYAGLAEDGRFNGTVRLLPDRLDQPLRWRRPRRIFVNSMSDLFHDSVPDEFIAQVFAVMALAQRHTFQVLTKRHGRMRSLLNSGPFIASVSGAVLRRAGKAGAVSIADPGSVVGARVAWPLPNVWLGVSVESQQWADIRIPALLDTPAAVRWVSAEPLLGAVDLRHHFAGHCPEHDFPGGFCVQRDHPGVRHLDWVVAGGESGPRARPMQPDWVRSLRDQCVATGVPFLFKQWGEWIGGSVSAGEFDDRFIPASMLADGSDWWDWPDPENPAWAPRIHAWPDGAYSLRVGKRQAGRLLDGVAHDEYPAVAANA